MRNKQKLWVLAMALTYSVGWTKPAYSQDGNSSLANYLAAVAKYNPSFSVLSARAEANKLGNLSLLTPPDPRVAMEYMKPTSRSSDKRFDWEISQSFDFPTTYTARKQVAKSRNELIDLETHTEWRTVHYAAMRDWIRLIYHKKLHEVRSTQLADAKRIAEVMNIAFQKGDISILQRDKAQLHASTIYQRLLSNELEMGELKSDLMIRIAGHEIPEAILEFPNWETLAADLGRGNTASAGLDKTAQELSSETNRQQVNIAQTEERLAKSERLPDFEIGYLREQDLDMQFQGLRFGLRIPLWQQKNKVKQAKLQVRAQEIEQDVAEQNLAIREKLWRERIAQIQEQEKTTEELLRSSKGPERLAKALSLGEITLTDYLVEQIQYIELQEHGLEVQLAYHLAQAEYWFWFGQGKQ